MDSRTAEAGIANPADSAVAEAGGAVSGLGPPGGRALRMARGVCRFLAAQGYSTLTEFPVGKGRRVDAIGLNRDRHFAIVEIKTSIADFRSDAKWPDYLPWCDAYYFAVPADFPADILPADQGLLVADAFDAAVIREAPVPDDECDPPPDPDPEIRARRRAAAATGSGPGPGRPLGHALLIYSFHALPRTGKKRGTAAL